MNPEVNSESRASRRSYSVNEFLASRRGKMFGIAEIVAVAVSCLVLALVLLSYLYFLVPARSRLTSANVELKQVQANLQTLTGVVNKEANTKQRVDQIATSLTTFETEHLLRPDQGRLDLYQELNQLIIKNNLKNTSGPTYTPLDPVGTKQTSGKSVTTKWQSFYPGIGVIMTVEGQYQDVRRFIRDIERSKQFVVINEVELQRATQTNTPVSVDGNGAAVPAATGSGTRASLVSLQLNMATYFQRGGASEQPAQ